MITVTFTDEIENITSNTHLYQWDKGQRLTIEGVTLTDTPVIHFANKKSDKALVILPELSPNKLTADIPNSLLQEPYPIIAYIYSYDEGKGKTIKTVYIPVEVRTKPDDYVFEGDNGFITLAEMQSKVDAMIRQANTDVDNMLNQCEADYNAFRTEKDKEIDDAIIDAEARYLASINELRTGFAEVEKLADEIEVSNNEMQESVAEMETVVGGLPGNLYTVDRYNKPAVTETTRVEEVTYTTNLFPSYSGWTTVTSNVAYTNADGYELTASSSYGSSYPATYALRSSSYFWVAKATSGSITMKLPEAKKIIKMKARITTKYTLSDVYGTNFNGATIKGSKDGTTWTDLYTVSTAQTERTEMTLNNADYYLYYRISINATGNADYCPAVSIWEVLEWKQNETFYGYTNNLSLPLASYELGKIVNIEGSSYEEITSFENPYLNINNLGAKQINGTIVAGGKYSLVYNGESWDKQTAVVIGSYTGDSTTDRDIPLDFTPTSLIVVSKSSGAVTFAINNGTRSSGITGVTTATGKEYAYGQKGSDRENMGVTIGQNKFTINGSSTWLDGFNYNGDIYNYIAFR